MLSAPYMIQSKNQSLWFLLDLCAYFVDTVTPKV